MTYNPVKFANEAYAELKKSTWLTRQQAVGSLTVVLILLAIMSLYISSVDFLLSVIVGALLGR